MYLPIVVTSWPIVVTPSSRPWCVCGERGGKRVPTWPIEKLPHDDAASFCLAVAADGLLIVTHLGQLSQTRPSMNLPRGLPAAEI